MLIVEESVTDASGAKPNEDAFGYAVDCAWVLDGATGLGDKIYDSAKPDARMIARQASRLLGNYGVRRDLELPDVIKRVVADLKTFHENHVVRSVKPHELPSCCLIFARLNGNKLETVSLGDCMLMLEYRGKIQEVAPDPVLNRLDRISLTEMRRVFRAGAKDWAEARAAIVGLLKANRAKMNAEDGYGVLAPDERCLDKARYAKLDVQEGTRLFLGSDGMTRLFDTFGLCEKADMLRQSPSLAELMTTLRDYEKTKIDPASGVLKRHDDATAIRCVIKTST